MCRLHATDDQLLATPYWTETNIADGLTALTICIEVCAAEDLNEAGL